MVVLRTISNSKEVKGFLISGIRFNIKEKNKNEKHKNSAVVVFAWLYHYLNRLVTNPKLREVLYYGILKDIIKKEYFKHTSFVMFKCKWFEVLGRSVVAPRMMNLD